MQGAGCVVLKCKVCDISYSSFLLLSFVFMCISGLPLRCQRIQLFHTNDNVNIIYSTYHFFVVFSHKAIVICTLGVDCPISVTYTYTHRLWHVVGSEVHCTWVEAVRCLHYQNAALNATLHVIFFLFSCRHYMHKNKLLLVLCRSIKYVLYPCTVEKLE